MADQFYLQDSRSYVGDNLTFWAKDGQGYVTDLDKAEVFTAEQATSHRDTDVPWPKTYIDARSHIGVDHQYLRLEDAAEQLVSGCPCVLQVVGEWNGNDMVFARKVIGRTADFSQAAQVSKEQAEALGNDPAEITLWPAAYVEQKTRRVVRRDRLAIKEALRGTGIKLAKPKKPREMMFNCHGCGRFISDRQRFHHDCLNCGADNRP
ncbi:hypothetical protein [Pseudomonas sp. NPDC088444]|uniref:hypothetical protein n=1 Tax=Pseudomonas sp. NPDC088444 TaxID=3364456 RepID=UPI00384F5EB0